MIRQYCDGELPRAEADRVEAAIAADAALAERIRCERRLRDSIADVLQTDCPCAPEGLAERIQSTIAAEPSPAAEPAPGKASGFRAAALLRGPQHANTFAVAATITLVLGAVLVGIFGTPIDSWEWSQPGVNLVGQAVPYVCGEHGRCSDSTQAVVQKTRFREPAAAGRELSAWLGAEVSAAPMCERLDEAGLVFVGGGPCAVPDSDRSAHMIFEMAGVDGAELVSVFMIPDTGRYEAEAKDDTIVAVMPGRSILAYHAPSRQEVWIYSDGRIVYMVVGPQEVLQEAASALLSVLNR